MPSPGRATKGAAGSTPSKPSAAPPAPAAQTSSGAAAATATATATPADANDEAAPVEIVKLGGGKPDPDANKRAMDDLKKQIDEAHAVVNNLRSLLSGSGPSKDTPQGKRRAELRAELEELRSKQAGSKGARGKVLDEVKALQDAIARKVKELQAAKAKANFRSVAEVDSRIARLEAQVESGSMKLVEERKALAEVSQLKRARKTVESFDASQAAIDEDRKRLESLRAQLDDPESRALSKRYDEIKAELDAIQAEAEKSVGSRQKLVEQREAASRRLDELYKARRDRYAAFKAASDAFYAKANAERERRLERQRDEKRQQEEARRKEQEAAMREEAALPAFAKEIEDCDVLIHYFQTRLGGGDAAANGGEGGGGGGAESGRSGVLGKKLEVRQVEVPKELQDAKVAKKKGAEDDSDNYFVAPPKGGKKNRGGGGSGAASTKSGAASADPAAGATSLHVPLGTLSALLQLSIPPPTSHADMARVVENLGRKRNYFVSNQAEQTRRNIERVEKALAKSSIADESAAIKEEAAPAGTTTTEASTA